MPLMNYQNNNTINLMASLVNAFSHQSNSYIYPELSSLPAEKIQSYDNVVLLILDGLSYKFLEKYFPFFLNNYPHTILQSVFPSATSIALTSIAT
ncbi:MAG: hypothetical protein LBP53_03380 [Candidatus Peribacteria bacterium]|jgi:hypothetical protein|nr:hypothetical protein [Candidatus Peribacteria bacterium]